MGKLLRQGRPKAKDCGRGSGYGVAIGHATGTPGAWVGPGSVRTRL